MDLKAHYITAIENYITAYNNFDVNGMCRHLSEEIVFENISGGNVEMSIKGIENFKKQADAATAYFESRKQSIEKWNFNGNIVTVNIDYTGILALDLPGGMKKGDTLRLKGISEFTFENGKIAALKDKS